MVLFFDSDSFELFQNTIEELPVDTGKSSFLTWIEGCQSLLALNSSLLKIWRIILTSLLSPRNIRIFFVSTKFLHEALDS